MRAWSCRTALIVSRLLQSSSPIVGGGLSGPCSANDGIVELGIASINCITPKKQCAQVWPKPYSIENCRSDSPNTRIEASGRADSPSQHIGNRSCPSIDRTHQQNSDSWVCTGLFTCIEYDRLYKLWMTVTTLVPLCPCVLCSLLCPPPLHFRSWHDFQQQGRRFVFERQSNFQSSPCCLLLTICR
jgi:hypothetical protein